MFEHGRALTNLRKKRNTVKGAITKLVHHLQDLENNPGRSNLLQAATLLLEKVQRYERDFKSFHEEIIESIDIEEHIIELEKEQDILDRQDETNENLILRLRVLLAGKGLEQQRVKEVLSELSGRSEHLPIVQQIHGGLTFHKDDLKEGQ